MASSSFCVRTPSVEAVLANLATRASGIPFATLVEHLERVLGASVGTGALVKDERLRFLHDPSLVFHAGDIARMSLSPDKVTITSTFLGATGTVSPMASFFTEDVLRASEEANTLGSFYDLFHHRLLALFYRATKRSRPAFGTRKSGTDPLTGRALATFGLFPPREGAALSSLAMLGRSRILARRSRSKQALEEALALSFPKLPFRLVDFVPRRIRLGSTQRLALGKANHSLGRETRIGRHMVGQSDRTRLEIGPVDRAAFERLLPGGRDYARLRGVVETVTGGLVDMEVAIQIQKGDEPRASLGRRSGSAGSKLGRSALVLQSRSDRTLHVRFLLNAAAEEARPVFFRT